jgi:hypothetical protein
MSLCSQRTGKESATATEKPPSTVAGTAGEAHIRNAKRRKQSTTITVRVRRVTGIGVGARRRVVGW